MIQITCSGCGKVYRIRDDPAGKRTRCKQCRTVILIPASMPVTVPGVTATAIARAPECSGSPETSRGRPFSPAGLVLDCPHCGHHVLATSEGACPSCRRIIPANLVPDEAWHEAEPSPGSAPRSHDDAEPRAPSGAAKSPTGLEATRDDDSKEESFGYTGLYKFNRVTSCGWPALIAGGILAAIIWVVGPSGGMIAFKNPEWTYFLLIASLIWLLVDILKVARAFGFSVGISNSSLRVGDRVLPWGEINRCEVRDHGEPAILVYPEDSAPLEVPRNIDGLGYIVSVVKRRVRK